MKKKVDKNLQLDATEKQEGPSRRTFLAGTGGAALAAAASGLLSGRALSQTSGAPPTLHPEKAPAPSKAATPNATTSLHYPHLLSPLKIGDHVLKNHIIGTPACPEYLVGPEAWPEEPMMISYGNKARAGAALIVVSQPFGVHPKNEEDALTSGAIINAGVNQDNPFQTGDGGIFPTWDLANTAGQNTLAQLTEEMHFYGSLCVWKHKLRMPDGYDVSPGNHDDDSGGGEKKEIPEEMLKKYIDFIALQASLAKTCGFDGMFVHMGYRGPITARMLSPLTNRRTDRYGGSTENRARFSIELIDAIKKKCGQDYFIMASMCGREIEGGFTLDEGAEYAKLFTPYIDLLDLKGDPGERDSAPTYFMKERTPFLYMTEGYKKRGVTLTLSCDGGFTNLDWAEEAIASGKTDGVGMARIFVTTPELGRLVEEGRNEDVVPCLRCNACHGNGDAFPSNSTCYVNPVWGLEHKIGRMVLPPRGKKKVAVIGGGPAGMEAALIAAQRGHSVTLYEKTGYLGGTLRTIENISFKWPHKDYKEYMIRQVTKAGVKMQLNTEPDPVAIRQAGYDAVLVAIGADPIVPEIPGIKGKNVVLMTDVFGKEDTLARDVVIIGGGLSGTETGIHLAEKGHLVTVLEEGKTLAPEIGARPHFASALQHAWEMQPNFKFVLQAHCTGVTEDGVTYTDAKGNSQAIKAGSVVLAAGLKPKSDAALKYAGTSNRFYLIGDCETAGDVRTAVRSAFGIASML